MEEESTDQAAQNRRYRVFLIIEGVLLVVAGFGCTAVVSHSVGKWVVWPLTVLLEWHVVAIPICIFYLIGRPIVMSLSPLIDSPQSRAFQRQLQSRPLLSDAEFYARYYEGTGIPIDIPTRVRRSLLNVDSLFEGAIPTDPLYLLDDDLDFADVLYFVEEEFGIQFTRADYEVIDGTLDSLVHLVHMRINGECCD